MAQLVVRNLDDDVKAKLQQRARQHGRSTEEEVRDILRNAVKDDGRDRAPLSQRFQALFGAFDLKDDEIPELRGQPAKPADFS